MSTEPITGPGDPRWLRRAEARLTAGPPVADGLTIAAFITVWFMPLAGLILAHFANDAADQAGRRRHGLARAAVVLGTLGVIAWVIIIVALVVSARSGVPTS